MFCGEWRQRGHSTIHPAGIGGRYEAEVKPVLQPCLENLGRTLSQRVQRYRPDIWNCLEENNLLERNFGIFHLFLCVLLEDQLCITTGMILFLFWL